MSDSLLTALLVANIISPVVTVGLLSEGLLTNSKDWRGVAGKRSKLS